MTERSKELKSKILGLLLHPSILLTVRSEHRYDLEKILSPVPKFELLKLQPSESEDNTKEEKKDSTVGSLPMMSASPGPNSMHSPVSSEKKFVRENKKHFSMPIEPPEVLEKLRAESKKEVLRIVKENSLDYPYELPETSDYVQYSEEVANIKFRHINIKQMKAATLDKIIENIASAQSLIFRDLLIITYDNYTTSYNLMLALLQRFFIPWPLNMSPKEVEIMLNSRFKVIQNKILAFLYFWMSERKDDFLDIQLRNLLDAFLGYVKEHNVYRKLNQRVIDTQITPLLTKISEGSSISKRVKTGVNFEPKEISLPSNIVNYDSLVSGATLLEFNTDLIAMQLALIDQKYFCKLTAADFIGKKKSSEAGFMTPKQKMTERHNLFTNFISAYILKEINQFAREAIIDKFIEVAKRSQEIGNLNSTFIIYTAITSYVLALKKTGPKIRAKHGKFLAELDHLFCSDETYGNLREYTRNLELPCVPCFYLWGKDMDTIFQIYKDDFVANPKGDLPGERKLINIIRQGLITDRMKDLTHFQKVKYIFYKVPMLYQFLEEDYKLALAIICDTSKADAIFSVFHQFLQKLEP